MEPEPPPEYAVATYEEIRERFRLGGTDQVRIKAKRRGWPIEPRNDPGALAHVRVPRKEWNAWNKPSVPQINSEHPRP